MKNPLVPLVAVAGLLTITNATLADSIDSSLEDLGLTGDNVIVFPQHRLPFIQSYRVVNHGTKEADGSCSFPLTEQGPAQPLGDNERWVTVQLGYDQDTCTEVLERGIVDDTKPEADILDLENSPTSQSGVLPGSPSDSTMAAAASTPTGEVRIWFTDGNHPVMQTLGNDGLLLSSQRLWGNLTGNQSPCRSNWGGEFTFDEDLGTFNWRRDIPTTEDLSLKCGQLTVATTARHINDKNLPPFYDCRDGGLLISYNAMKLTVNYSSANTLSGSVNVSGDSQDCREYAQRWQEGPT